MCYDVSYLTRKAEKYAKHHGTKQDWEDIKKRLPPTYHASGFDEPQLPGIIADEKRIVALDWPFIPSVFAPSSADGRPLNTLNARDDKIFTKRSIYYKSAHDQRCVIVLDGFFDHHHKDGIAFPHFVQLKNGEPMLVAALWQTFVKNDVERDCATLVTTRANKEMAWIHNEPAYSPESRMLFLLPNAEAKEIWLNGTAKEAQEIIRPLPDDVLDYYPSRPVRSNKKLNRLYPGNTPEVLEKVYYPELEESQGSLF